MVVDDQLGFVESLNWEPKDLTKTRDYAIVTTHGHEVAEMVACFDADWEHKDFEPRPRFAADLVPEQRPPTHRRTSSTRPGRRCGCRTSVTRIR